jgi:hypothetical protein
VNDLGGSRILLAFVALAVAAASAVAGERLAAGFVLLPLTAPRADVARATNAPAPGPRPLCVRLCDGYFFPLPAASGPFASADEENACRALCPAASVALYHLPARSDLVADATLASGEPYSALPTAFRYRGGGAPVCACQSAAAAGLDYWRDPTLRSGDAVMTAQGVVVFHGAAGAAPYTSADFTPLGSAAISPPQRSALSALTPAIAADSDGEESAAIGEARRVGAAASGGEIRFLAAPTGGGG